MDFSMYVQTRREKIHIRADVNLKQMWKISSKVFQLHTNLKFSVIKHQKFPPAAGKDCVKFNFTSFSKLSRKKSMYVKT